MSFISKNGNGAGNDPGRIKRLVRESKFNTKKKELYTVEFDFVIPGDMHVRARSEEGALTAFRRFLRSDEDDNILDFLNWDSKRVVNVEAKKTPDAIPVFALDEDDIRKSL